MRNRFIIVIVSLLFSTSIFAQSMQRYDLKQLKYNLSKEAVVKLWGDPDNKSETGIILYEYNTEDSVIYLNFFTDNLSLSNSKYFALMTGAMRYWDESYKYLSMAEMEAFSKTLNLFAAWISPSK